MAPQIEIKKVRVSTKEKIYHVIISSVYIKYWDLDGLKSKDLGISFALGSKIVSKWLLL